MMCSDGKQCYRKIGNELIETSPKTLEEMLSLSDVRKGSGMSNASIVMANRISELIEKRKESNITSDGSLLGDYVR